MAGNEDSLDVGQTASLVCTSDLEVDSITWLYEGQTVSSHVGLSGELLFSPVNTSIHGKEYTCRATTAYGILEKTVTVYVNGMPELS